MNPPRPSAEPAHLGWRLLALVYDSLPVLAIWIAFSALVLALRGGVPISPWSAAFWLQNLALWGIAGLYAVGSWLRGGQTLGMRPWRLRVVDAEGRPAGRAALLRRFVWATAAWFPLGLGYLWSVFDAERCSLHDRLSRTRLVRLPAAN